MTNKYFDAGLKVRKQVLGEKYVEDALANASEFTRDFQEFATEHCWGACWTRGGISDKTRSLLNIAILAAAGRERELKLHVGGAIRNGATKEEIKEVLIQVAVYCGIPAANDGFRIADEALADFDQ